LFPTPSVSPTVKTPDPQCPGPSALLAEAEETPPKIQGDPHRPEPAAEGNIQMEYSSSTGAVTKKLPVRI
jgi:hypothetical protein